MRVRLPDDFPKDVKGLQRGILPAPYNPADVAAQSARVINVVPWWETKPPQGLDFLEVNKSTVLAAGAGSAVELLSFTLPPETFGVIKVVSIFADATTTDTDVDWTLRFNSGPVPGWNNLTTFPRAAANLSIDYSGTILVTPGTNISVTAQNGNAFGPWTIGVLVAGWYLSQSELQRVYGDLTQGY
jgi:hypothetical protein